VITRSDAEGSVGVHTKLNHTNIEAVRFGLKGWKNFKDTHGNDIPFKTVKRHTNGRTYHVVVDECLERLGIQDIRELGQEIKRRSEASRAEEKKSATA
jgi:hypothetical protein